MKRQAERPEAARPAAEGPSPEQVFKMFADRPPPVDSERRRTARAPIMSPVNVVVRDTSPNRQWEVEFSAVLSDISERGCSMVSIGFICPGTPVRVIFNSLPDQPSLLGLIVSSIQLSPGQFRTGIQFVESSMLDISAH